jgi:hypothetical protein
LHPDLSPGQPSFERIEILLTTISRHLLDSKALIVWEQNDAPRAVEYDISRPENVLFGIGVGCK